ncbi:DUF996 domain-containing protein [Palaeococcus sp. (in: euryarchaeotes)]|uniref:DUF996 domain-containing protein n=1 Tax=Palaeococcus sp. (in: euryarchaeotes) TaxID=2820298 RepID=UPI0025EBB5E5|nr:DUF996 domain-containing protein [Palaeococcus sp. (in: euryarchaeotes)]
MRYASVEGIKTLLIMGSFLVLIVMIPGIGSIAGFIGGLLYIHGLYKWSHAIDGRPFKLAMINFVVSTIGFAVAIGGLTRVNYELGFEFSLFKIIYAFILLLYPFLVVGALLHREVLKCFYRATKVEDFLIAGDLTLYGALLMPLLIGVVISLIARIMEISAYNNMPSKVEVLKERELEINRREFVTFPPVAVIIALVLLHFIVPSYDVKLTQDDVKFLGKIEGDFIDGMIVYDFPCMQNYCIREVKVDGKTMYSGGTYTFINGKHVVHVTIPKDARHIEVVLDTGEVVSLEIPYS